MCMYNMWSSVERPDHTTRQGGKRWSSKMVLAPLYSSHLAVEEHFSERPRSSGEVPSLSGPPNKNSRSHMVHQRLKLLAPLLLSL
jgi:hypothetical protein